MFVKGFEFMETSRMLYISGGFFTKKVMPIIGVFPSANFPQEKYFSPRKVFFPKKSIFPQEKYFSPSNQFSLH